MGQTPPNTSFFKRRQGRKDLFCGPVEAYTVECKPVSPAPSSATVLYPTCVSKTCHSLNTPSPPSNPPCHSMCWATQNALCFQQIPSHPAISSSDITFSVKHCPTKNELVGAAALSFPCMTCTISPVILHCALISCSHTTFSL